MFTAEQIKEAHGKVKSGTDFPQFVQDLIVLGVEKYDTFVRDGHSEYFGADHFRTNSPTKYEALEIMAKSDKDGFLSRLKNHQQGNTDYRTFCNDCAATGVEKWNVDTTKMTCTYYDKTGNTMLIEKIPEKLR